MSGLAKTRFFPTRLGMLSCLLVLVPCPSPASDFDLLGKEAWGMLAGYGFQHKAWAEESGEEIELSLFYPTAKLASWALDPWLVRLDLQGVLGTRTNGAQGIFAGGGPVIRVHYHPNRLPFSPYLHLGAGVSYTDMDLNGMGTRENFFEEVGAGFKVQAFRRLSLSGEYRMMHVSNAGLSRDNIGLNSHVVLLGAWYSF